jgi:MSHA pilin protein MshC
VNNVNNLKNKRLNQGFTLLELIIVIIILGILSVTVAPKFFTVKGFSAYGYRTDVIAKLRLIQIKAMQQTQATPEDTSQGNNNYCHRVLLTNKKLGTPDVCDDTPSFASTWQDSATKVKIADQDEVTLSSNITGNSFIFDSMGRPSCVAPCIITINGEQTISVQIESEGYIHAL